MKTYLTVLAVLTVTTVAGWAESEKVQASAQSLTPVRNGLQGAALEPAEQGISNLDLLTTRDINQDIASASRLSASGRDVRVATYRGRVDLRGVVQSPEEKRRLEEIAARHAGAQNVRNELEVRAAGE